MTAMEKQQITEEIGIINSQRDEISKYKTKGAIIRSRARWYNDGEKNTKYFLNLQSATKLVETVANRAHWQRHIHCLQRKRVQKVRFRDTPPSPTLINVVPLSTRLVENRKTQHCPGGAGEGAICAAELEIDSKG